MQLYDRELLEHDMIRLGLSEAEMEKVDERPAGIFQRFRPGSVYQRYIEVPRTDRATPGGSRRRNPGGAGRQLPAPRGPACFPRPARRAHAGPRARVMEYRWSARAWPKSWPPRATPSGRSFMKATSASTGPAPEYHLTVNSGRLGPLALTWFRLGAQRHWSRSES